MRNQPTFPGHGSAINGQQTFILMWNPEISSVSLDYHRHRIRHIHDAQLNWSVHEWKKAHAGDRFYLVRVGRGNTGIVMSGLFTSEPWRANDWNPNRRSREIRYMDMQANFIADPEEATIITTAQLQAAIPDFEWTGGHSGTLLRPDQADRLEALFAPYLAAMHNHVDHTSLWTDDDL